MKEALKIKYSEILSLVEFASEKIRAKIVKEGQ